jgi:hypothetical protein
LILDSLSIIGTSATVRNLVLKPDSINESLGGVKLLSGLIEEVSLEAQIIEKKVVTNISGVFVNLLLPFDFIEKILDRKKSSHKFTDEFLLSFSKENNQKNFLFELLNQISFIIGGVTNININLYFNIDTCVHNFTLKINEMGFTNVTVKENNITKSFSINGLSLTMMTFNKENSIEIFTKEEIQNLVKINGENFANQIINNITCVITIGAFRNRFERSVIDLHELEENEKNELCSNFENFAFNLKFDIHVKFCEIETNQTVIKNILKAVYFMENIKLIKRQKHKNIRELFGKAFTAVRKLKTLKTMITKDEGLEDYFDSFITPDLAKAELLNISSYLFIQLVLRKYVDYKINHYLLINLAYRYKKIMGSESPMLDYLLEKYIHLFVKAKSNLKVEAMFIDTDIIDQRSDKSLNQAIKEFIFFIIDKYREIKKLLEDKNSYDDFCKINLTINKFSVVLKNAYAKEDKLDSNLISSLNYIRDGMQARNRLNEDITFSNELIWLEIENMSSSIYTNFGEYFFLNMAVRSLTLWDISYRRINNSELTSRYLPILKVEFDTQLTLYKIKNNLHRVVLQVPVVYSCIDPYCLFFINTYIQRIKYDLDKYIEDRNLYESINPSETDLSDSTSELNSYSSSIYGVYGIKDQYKENIQQIDDEDNSYRIINFAFSVSRLIINHNFTEYVPNTISFVFNVNLINYEFCRSRQTSKFTLEEIIGGTVKNDNIINFLNYSSGLNFKTNILNLFGLIFPIDYSRIRKHCQMSFYMPEIYIKLNKDDINLIQKNIFDFNRIVVLKNEFQFTYTPEDAEISLGLNRRNNRRKTGLNKNDERFFFLSIEIKKIVIQAKLDNDEEYSESIKKSLIIYRHLIIVMDNINFYSYSSKINNDFMFTIRRLVTILRYFDLNRKSVPYINGYTEGEKIKFEKKLFEINSKSFEHKLLSLKEYQEAKSGRRFEKIENLFYVGTFGKTGNLKKYIVIKTNPIYIGFDHLLTSYIIDNFKLKQNDLAQNLDNNVEALIFGDNNNNNNNNNNNIAQGVGTHKDSKSEAANLRRSFTIVGIKDRSVTNILLQTNQIKIETFLENKPFLVLECENFEFKNDERNIYRMTTNVKYLTDERDISKTNKFIIFNNEINLGIDISDTGVNIRLNNPKYIFLNRILMDVIEYVYYILLNEVYYQLSYDEIYTKTPEEIIEIVKTRKNSQVVETNINYVNNNLDIENNSIEYSSVRRDSINKRRAVKTTSHFAKSNVPRLDDNFKTEYTVVSANKKPPAIFVITLTVTNGEILIPMNSLKNSNKMLLKFSKLELINYSQYLPKIIQVFRNKLKNLSENVLTKCSEPLTKIDYYIRVEDAKLIHNITENNTDDIARFNIKDNGQFTEANDIGCINIAIDLSTNLKYLSTTRVYILIPFFKLRLFSDVYEKILRIFFENLYENPLVKSKGTQMSHEYFKNNNIDHVYCETYFLVDDLIASVYNFPSTCMLHKDKKSNWHHDNSFKCKTSKLKANVQLTKLCTFKVKNFSLIMILKNNDEKISLLEFDSIISELNKYHNSFSKLHSTILLNSTGKNEKAFYGEIIMNSRKNQQLYNLEFMDIEVNFLRLPLMALYRFFAKYFFYYQNKNIKIVNYGGVQNKQMIIFLHNFNFYIQSNNVEINRTYYELNITTDFKITTKMAGNSLLGPIEDLKIYEFLIKEMYLCDMKHKSGKDLNTYKNQICSEVYILFNILTRATDRLQPENTFYYLFGEIDHSDRKDSNLDYFIYKDPCEYKEYIKNFVFKEKDLLGKDLGQGRDSKALYHPFRISLNILQLTYIQKIMNDMQIYDKENYYNILYTEEKSSYDKILFNCFYSFYIKEIQLEITDYQFNSKLFQITIENLFSYITNYPKNQELIEYAEEIDNKHFNLYKTNKSERKKMSGFPKGSILLSNVELQENKSSNIYSMVSPQQLPIREDFNIDDDDDDKGYNLDSLTKFVAKVYYHNINNKNWEPLIEPLPASLSFFKNEDKQYLHFHLLSLLQNDLGIENICRQKNFHSLNININEFMFESIRALITDYEVFQDKQLISLNLDQTKQLVVRNLTEYKISIEDNGVFIKDINEESDNTKIAYIYNNDKSIDYKEVLGVTFTNDDKNKKKDNSNNYGDNSLKRNKVSIIEIQTGNNIEFEDPLDNYNSYNTFSFNIEKTSKVFSIFNETGKKYRKQEIEEELSKNYYHSNKKILLPGERFLVTEVTINNEKNKKNVSFRSNEGIKNELDFPLKLKFVYRDNVNVNSLYENPIIILPGCIFYIPNNIIDKVKEVEFTPYLYINDIRFHPTRCNISEISNSTKSDDINILVFFLKGSKSTDEFSLPYFDHIVCSIVKKYEIAENEFIDNNIKKRIELMKNLSDFKESGTDKITDNEQRFDHLLCDYTYVLTPVMKFYNSLPRNILISKMLPKDILSNTRTKGDYEELINYFDIEAVCNKTSQFYKDELKQIKDFNNMNPQDFYVSWSEGDYDYYQDRKNEIIKKNNQNVVNGDINFENHQNKNNFDNQISIKANGGYLAIYEPFLFKEKYAKYLQFKIATEELESTSYLNEKINKKLLRRKTFGNITDKTEIKIKKYYDKFLIFPFKVRSLLKSLHENMSIEDVDRTKLKFFKFNFKEDHREPIKIKSKNNYENLNYSIEIDENKVLKTYLYCPYLFVNTTDMKIQLEYQGLKTKELLSENRGTRIEEEFDDEYRK